MAPSTSPMPQNSPQVHAADHAQDLAHRLARHIAQRLRQAIALRGHAVLAVSGGKSPIALFEQLRVQALDWAQVSVLLVDERCVPHQHADSNTRLVHTHLLQDAAREATFVAFFDQVPPAPDDEVLQQIADQANQRLAAHAWPIDVAVLGMGEDGHTASLFPGAPALGRALSDVGPITWLRPSAASNAPHARLTLTLPALLASREIALSISGATKLAVYQQASRSADKHLPVSLVLHQHQAPVSVWLA